MNQKTSRTTAALLLFLLAGCARNPFVLDDLDRAPRKPEERLRRLETANLERFAQPKSDAPPSDDVVRRRFEGVEKMEMKIEDAR